MSKNKIRIVRIGNKLIVVDGINHLAYVDLTKVNKGNKYKAIVRYKPVAKLPSRV